jgi:hypothetical protein
MHPDQTLALIDTYLTLTKEVLPARARAAPQLWPVCEDHCFQRIVLDTLCGGIWHEHIARPAYKNLTHDQARRAVHLCHAILDGRANIADLNVQSLDWRSRPAQMRLF